MKLTCPPEMADRLFLLTACGSVGKLQGAAALGDGREFFDRSISLKDPLLCSPFMDGFLEFWGLPRPRASWLVAIHEAGHAVVAWHSPCCEKVEFARLGGSRSDAAGMTRAIFCLLRDPAELLWEEMVFVFGGIAAETMVAKKTRPGGSRGDLARGRDAALLLAASPTPSAPWVDRRVPELDVAAMFKERPNARACRIMAIGYRRARYLVEFFEPQVRLLAAQIAKRGQVTGDEMAPLLGPRLAL